MTAVKLLLSVQAMTDFWSTVVLKGVDLKTNIGVSKNEMLYIQLPNRKLTAFKMYLFEFKQTGFEWQTTPVATSADKMLDCLGMQGEVIQNSTISGTKEFSFSLEYSQWLQPRK